MQLADIWVEKYRPKDLDSLYLSDVNRTFFQKVKETKHLPNLLLTGTPGIGKTSLAKIIPNDILSCQYLYINASDESGIDTIRNKVINFAQTMSIDGNIKVIILDEADGITSSGQAALRNCIEEYHEITRFILTANYQNKIIPALKSRCQHIDLTLDKKTYTKCVISIINKEKIKIDKDRLRTLIHTYYPDLRFIINDLQKYHLSGDTTAHLISDDFIKNIIDHLNNKSVFKLRKLVIESENIFNGNYDFLLKKVFDHLDKHLDNGDKKRDCLITISEHLYQMAFVLDHEINFYACMLNLSKIITNRFQ